VQLEPTATHQVPVRVPLALWATIVQQEAQQLHLVLLEATVQLFPRHSVHLEHTAAQLGPAYALLALLATIVLQEAK
jgi:hypothetical protein